MNILLVSEFLPDEKRPIIMGGVQARNFFLSKYLGGKHHTQHLSMRRGRIEATTSSMLPRLAFALHVMAGKPKTKPDIVEASNVATYLPAFILAKRLKVPAVAWVPDILGNSWIKNFPLPVAIAGMTIEWLSIRLPLSHLIAMSKATRDKLVGLGVDPGKITIIYGGIEYEKLSTLAVKKFDRPTICTIARLLSYKRIEDLIGAVALVKRKIPEVFCLIIGEGPQEQGLRSKIEKLQLGANVKMVGNVPHEDAMKLLKRSHLFCLPSLIEGFGIVTIEAMASGVPYVNARIKPTMEITQNGKGGLLFRPKDPKELAEKVLTLLTEEKLYAQKREEGQALSKNFDWSIIAKQTEAVYQQVRKDFHEACAIEH